MTEPFNEKTLRRISILLAIQKGLLGFVTAKLRAVFVGWDMNSIDLYFIYDGEASDEDLEESECAATEVLAYFPDGNFETHHIRCDFPKPIPEFGNEVVFRRKEALP